MGEQVLGFLQLLLQAISRNFLKVLAYPLDPGERVHLLYLATSLLMAVGAWRMLARRQGEPGAAISFGQFLFPNSIWRTRSAWLDIRYFFFHQILRVFLYGSFFMAVSDWTFRAISGVPGTAPGPGVASHAAAGWLVEIGYAVLSVAALDFAAYLLHYCQHRFSVLWEFHRVHHSARVMHPLTNYREHPVDNLTYAAGLGACTGLVAAVVSALLGYVPSQPTVFGVGIFVFVYNVLGYNLRHSHIWLKWPGPLVYVFGCPAHHQVHHSYHPTHINKNFAFMFPVWDLVFGTFEMPATDADVKFGLDAQEEEEFNSCVDLYLVPFRNIARRLLPPEWRPASPNEEIVRPESP